MASLWTELKRRNVIRVSVLYAVAGWVLLQIADILFGTIILISLNNCIKNFL